MHIKSTHLYASQTVLSTTEHHEQNLVCIGSSVHRFLLTTDAKLAHPISGMEISKNNKSFLDKLYDAPLNEPLALSFAEELYLYACTHLVASFTTDPQFMTLFYKVMHVPADNHVTETERAAASKNFCATLSMMMEVIETKIGEDTLFMLQKELLNTELPLE